MRFSGKKGILENQIFSIFFLKHNTTSLYRFLSMETVKVRMIPILSFFSFFNERLGELKRKISDLGPLKNSKYPRKTSTKQ